MKILSARGLVFLALFALLAFIGLQLNIFALQGVTGKSFTLFEFFGPMAGGFLGLAGVAAVGIAKLSAAMFGGAAFTLIDLAKLTPMLFAAYYFWKNGIKDLSGISLVAVPIMAMIAFWLHPVGAQAWYYALYWMIPVIGALFLSIPAWFCEVVHNAAKGIIPSPLFYLMTKTWDISTLYIRSLGATFTAHAVGSVLFLYTIPSVPALWIGLLPIVAIERTLFALGITFSYLVFVNVLNAVDTVFEISKDLDLEKRYVLQLQD